MAVYGGPGAGSPGFVPAGRIRFEAIGEAFEELKRSFGIWVVSALIVLVIVFGIAIVFEAMTGLLGVLSGRHDNGFSGLDGSIKGALLGGSIGLKITGQIITSVVVMVLTAGQYKMALKALRGLPIQVPDMFSTVDLAPALIIAGLIVGILQSIGFVCCCFPAVIIAAIFMFTVPLIVDKNAGAIDAMRASFEGWKRDPVMATLFLIVIALCSASGVVLCCIGLVLTQALMPIGIAIAYRDIFENPAPAAAGQQFTPPAAPAPAVEHPVVSDTPTQPEESNPAEPTV